MSLIITTVCTLQALPEGGTTTPLTLCWQLPATGSVFNGAAGTANDGMGSKLIPLVRIDCNSPYDLTLGAQ